MKMNKLKNQDGGITVFLVLIMISVIAAFLAFAKMSAEYLKENKMNRAVIQANRNIQASYDVDLYDNYGILAYKEDVAKDEALETLTQELSSVPGLIVAENESVSWNITKGEDIAYLNGLKEQILEQTYARIPMSVIETMEDNSTIVNKIRKAREKIEANEAVMKKIKDVGELNKKLGKKMDKMKETTSELSANVNMSGKVSIAKLDEFENIKEDSVKEIEGMLERYEECKAEIEAYKQELLMAKDELPDDFVTQYGQTLDDTLQETMDNIDKAIRSISVDTGSVSTPHLSQKKDSIRQTWLNVCDDTAVVDSLMASYGNDLAKYDAMIEGLEELEKDWKSDNRSAIRKIKDKDKSYSYRKKKRKSLQEDLNDELEDALEDVSIEVKKTTETVDQASKDYVDYLDGFGLGSLKPKEGNPPKEDRLSAEVITSADFGNLPSKVIPSQIGNTDQLTIERIDRFVMTEYIMGTFKHRLTDTWAERGETIPGAWDFYDMTKRNSFFSDGEIEYIIAGHNGETTNRVMVAGEIYLIREAANLVHVYTCKKKLTTAKIISSAASFWPWLVPVVKHGILIGWASIESGVDLSRLLNGYTVPTIKYDDSQWYTNLDISKKSVDDMLDSSVKNSVKESVKDSVDLTKKSNATISGANLSKGKTSSSKKSTDWASLNDQNYTFYLRLLLNADVVFNTKSSGVKRLNRILDVIYLNQTDKVSFDNYWTSHNLSIDWSGGQVDYDASYIE